MRGSGLGLDHWNGVLGGRLRPGGGEGGGHNDVGPQEADALQLVRLQQVGQLAGHHLRTAPAPGYPTLRNIDKPRIKQTQ